MNRRHYLILGAAILAFAGMVVLVTAGVVSRRRSRDFLFGLERLDVLLERGELDSAAELVPFLAERAEDATSLLSVLKRGLVIENSGGSIDAVIEASRIGLGTFPGNDRIRAIGTYAAIQGGESATGLEWSRALLDSELESFFAWALLSAGISPATLEIPDTGDALFLAGLGPNPAVEDLRRAWRVSSDWRYAADAAIALMKHGQVSEAAATTSDASLALRAPLLAADIFSDAREPELVLAALANSEQRETPEVQLRVADAHMRTGDYSSAAAVYRDIISGRPGFSVIPYLNLAWLAGTEAEQAELLTQAVQVRPTSWADVEQRALFLARENPARAFESISGFTGPDAPSRVSLLRLRLAPDREMDGYEAAIWQLLAEDADSEDAFRYAAWYFAGRGQYADLARVLERAPNSGSWVETYAGLMSASTGSWERARSHLLSAHQASPSWRSAYNLAVAELARGATGAGREWLADSAERASAAGYPSGSERVFVTQARVAETSGAARDAALKALDIDPMNQRAMLILERVGR